VNSLDKESHDGRGHHLKQCCERGHDLGGGPLGGVVRGLVFKRGRKGGGGSLTKESHARFFKSINPVLPTK